MGNPDFLPNVPRDRAVVWALIAALVLLGLVWARAVYLAGG